MVELLTLIFSDNSGSGFVSVFKFSDFLKSFGPVAACVKNVNHGRDIWHNCRSVERNLVQQMVSGLSDIKRSNIIIENGARWYFVFGFQTNCQQVVSLCDFRNQGAAALHWRTTKEELYFIF
jgi:hypothetical protein